MSGGLSSAMVREAMGRLAEPFTSHDILAALGVNGGDGRRQHVAQILLELTQGEELAKIASGQTGLRAAKWAYRRTKIFGLKKRGRAPEEIVQERLQQASQFAAALSLQDLCCAWFARREEEKRRAAAD